MQSKDAFSAYHPVVNFLYFALVLLFSMFLLHPLCLAVSPDGRSVVCCDFAREAGGMA
ncbi:MAG: hypothetical protein ACLVHV_07215 [Oscillospiraceae bacterium]